MGALVSGYPKFDAKRGPKKVKKDSPQNAQNRVQKWFFFGIPFEDAFKTPDILDPKWLPKWSQNRSFFERLELFKIL